MPKRRFGKKEVKEEYISLEESNEDWAFVMTNFQSDMFALIRGAIYNEKVSLSAEFDWNEALELGKRHQILPLMCYGALLSAGAVAADVLSKLKERLYKSIIVDEQQKYLLSQIKEAFQNNNIDFVVLKGAELKKLYPKSEMRLMGDIDILIRTSQYGAIKRVMTFLGFREGIESNHEYQWIKDGFLVELHKCLIPSYNEDYYSYYKDGWGVVKPKGGTEYDFSPEDKLVYVFTHLAKHYRDGGIGLRQFIDIYMICKAYPDRNLEDIEEKLKTLRLYDFYKNVIKTLKTWFEGKESDEKTDFITNKVFGSNSFETSEEKLIATAVKDNKNGLLILRAKKIFQKTFLPYGDMCKKYLILKKVPIFLPAMWIVRFWGALFFRRKNIKKNVDEIKLISESNTEQHKKDLNFVGLDFGS